MSESRRQRLRQHVRRYKRKYSWGAAAVAFVVVQMAWDIGANDIAAYFQPLFTTILGPPPAP